MTERCPMGHYRIVCQHCGLVVAECSCDAVPPVKSTTLDICASCRRKREAGELPPTPLAL